MSSVNNQVGDVLVLMQEEKLNVLALTKTWHKNSDCTTIKPLWSWKKLREAARLIDDKQRRENVNWKP